MVRFMVMAIIKISKGGQVSVPATIRKRWGTSRLTLEDRGDELVLRPAPDDPIAAFRGSLKGRVHRTSDEMRAQARLEDEEAAARRFGGR